MKLKTKSISPEKYLETFDHSYGETKKIIDTLVESVSQKIKVTKDLRVVMAQLNAEVILNLEQFNHSELVWIISTLAVELHSEKSNNTSFSE